MPQPAKTVIGYVVDVQGNQLTASLVEDDQGRAPTVTIGDEDILVGQLGSYVAIRQHDVNIIAIVTRMTEQEALAAPSIETPGEDAARLPFAKRIARLTPIGCIRTDGQFNRGVGRYPTTGAEVHAVGATDIAKMFERFQSKGFSVGTVATHPSLKVCLDPSNLFGRPLCDSWANRIGQVVDGRCFGAAHGRRHAPRPHHHLGLARGILLEAGGREPTLRLCGYDYPAR